MWEGWVHHSWRFGHADALREVGPEMPERGSKMSTVAVVWENLEFFRPDPNDFLSRLLTIAESLLHHYDPETKQQSMEWRDSDSTRPKKFRVQKSAGKVLASIFWDKDGILLIDYLSKGQTINAEYYSSLLVQFKDTLKEKRRGKVTKVVLFLHDNAPTQRALATDKKLAYLGFHCLNHPPYFPDLAPSEYHLFSGLKKTNEWSPFFVRRGGHCCRGDLVERTNFWYFLSGLQKWEQSSVLSFVGSILNKFRVWSL